MNNVNTKNKMLIDSTHPEETRVVVLRNGRIEEFDWESAARKLLRGNIYLAKVTRVEPSLQAAFVDYGGNRHGFLAFSEIHPDYYQIPMADRQALLEEEAEAEEAKAKAEAAADAALSEGDEGEEPSGRHRNDRSRGHRNDHRSRAPREDALRPENAGDTSAETPVDASGAAEHIDGNRNEPAAWREAQPSTHEGQLHEPNIGEVNPTASQGHFEQGHPDAGHRDSEHERAHSHPRHDDGAAVTHQAVTHEHPEHPHHDVTTEATGASAALNMPVDRIVDEQRYSDAAPSGHEHQNVDEHRHHDSAHGSDQHLAYEAESVSDREDDRRHRHGISDEGSELGSRVVEVVEPEGGANEIETVGSEDAVEEIPERPRRYARQYKIQEVIRRRQIILVQVVKEERGNKGAALTTYLSLAGRYTVLMPNTARGGGISRKIANSADRKRLRKIVTELEVPKGMGLIVRTAGASRTKAEIKRDFEYLLRLWESVRDLTLRSTAPALVYEEGDLIKRSIRDLYSKEIEDITVAGEQAYASARDFMQMLMPSHVGNVIPYRAPEPLFTKYQIERQLNAMFSPFVTLRSGGYIVINQTEALVSIDINSGKSTREHNIEDTAFKTNLEASEEIARQLKLRDLAGLIVIDYIDMEEKRNNRAVERRLKESLRHDRARIQVGRISHFGLLEMSRQRLRPGVLEGSTSQCPHCQGTGTIRSTESVALAVLRGIEDKMMAGERFNIVAQTTADVALYILNQKRHFLNDMESRYDVTISILSSDKIHGANFVIERGPAIEERQPVRRVDVVQMDASHHGAAGSWDTALGDEEGYADEPMDVSDDTGGDDAGSEEMREGADTSEDGGAGDSEKRGRRRRRRRRGGGRNGVEGHAGEHAADDSEDGQHQRGDDVHDHVTHARTDHDDEHVTRTQSSRHHDYTDGEPGVQEIDSDSEIETIGGDGEGSSAEDEAAQTGGSHEGGPRADGDRNSDGRRRRRGRRGGRRGGRDRDGEGTGPDQGASHQAGQQGGHGSDDLPIARPDEWLHHEPTVGDMAAEQRRRAAQEGQPSYFSPVSEGEKRTHTEKPSWRRPEADTFRTATVDDGAAEHRHDQQVHAEVTSSRNESASSHNIEQTRDHGVTAPNGGSSTWHSVTEPMPTQFDGIHPPPSPIPSWEPEPAQPTVAQTSSDTSGHGAPSEHIVVHAETAPVVTAEPIVEPKAVEPPPPPEPPRPRKSGWWSRRLGN